MSLFGIGIGIASFNTSVTLLAYIDPGAGLAALGAALALVGTFVSMALGLVWYPLKRILRRNRGDKTSAEPVTMATTESGDSEA